MVCGEEDVDNDHDDFSTGTVPEPTTNSPTTGVPDLKPQPVTKPSSFHPNMFHWLLARHLD